MREELERMVGKMYGTVHLDASDLSRRARPWSDLVRVNGGERYSFFAAATTPRPREPLFVGGSLGALIAQVAYILFGM